MTYAAISTERLTTSRDREERGRIEIDVGLPGGAVAHHPKEAGWRERTGTHTASNREGHQYWVYSFPPSRRQTEGRHHQAGQRRTHGDDAGREDEEHEGQDGRMLPHVTQHTLDDPIDRAIHAGDGKEVGDPDQEDHDADGETAHDVLKRHPGQPHADATGGREHDDANMYVAERRDGERSDEDADSRKRSDHSSVPV